MPSFAYTARRKSGDRASGTVAAPDRSSAIRRLESIGLLPVTVNDIADVGKAYASISKNMVWSGRPSIICFLPILLFACFVFLIGILLAVVAGVGFGLLICSCAAVVFFYKLFEWMSLQYTITIQRVVVKQGIFSCRTREVAISDIRSINMNQNLFELMFGVGTIEIGSASTSEMEITIAGIRNPEELRDTLRRLKDSAAR